MMARAFSRIAVTILETMGTRKMSMTFVIILLKLNLRRVDFAL